eukprot:TRINITY_DN12761_c0_g1_i11.p1 TRINITY_DN12761_c0_g1~~TRINITY_DN12761_c0_g1_i11.p1  ORF type:complete len:376 (-),score=98.17 TRINITY_DN12761_c0_g1_i11:216-1262(-)
MCIRDRSNTLYSKEKGAEVSIDDFNLLKVLGRGSFGKVMLVEKKDTKAIYALKSLRKEDVIEKDQLEHTKTEKMIMEHVNHPYLVGLEYCFQTDEKIFFVMQFMKGGELFQHLRTSKRFEEQRAKFYAAQVGLGLGHLHSKDIVYRDLKPENVLMDEEGNVHLTDFGMAKIIRKNETSQSFCGTPEYLAPEIIVGEGHNKMADWWSYGVLIYEMLHGIPPFYHQNQNTMYELIATGKLKFSTSIIISEDAKDLLTKLLNKDQRKRFGCSADFDEIKAHPWFADINFNALLEKKLPTPFQPKVSGGDWVKNFDEEFTREEAINSYQPTNMNLIKQYQDEFDTFNSAKKL